MRTVEPRAVCRNANDACGRPRAAYREESAISNFLFLKGGAFCQVSKSKRTLSGVEAGRV